MGNTFENEVKLYMIFDILGDTVRSGPMLWHIERERLEDIKNHILDLILIYRMIKKYLPEYIDENKVIDYIICHDLPEAITGDITRFEGVSDEEIKRVTKIAIDYLVEKFQGVLDLNKILNGYEARLDIETKVVHMIDKLHSAIAFIKYQSEKDIDMDNPKIIPILRNHPFVVQKIAEGCDLADIFYQFHMNAITISSEECIKYQITEEEAKKIVEAIKGFAEELYRQKVNNILLNGKNEFPKDAMKYRRDTTI